MVIVRSVNACKVNWSLVTDMSKVLYASCVHRAFTKICRSRSKSRMPKCRNGSNGYVCRPGLFNSRYLRGASDGVSPKGHPPPGKMAFADEV
jgi:hypothetical protein